LFNAGSAVVANFLGHVVLITCSGLQCQKNMNQCLCIGAPPDPVASLNAYLSDQYSPRKEFGKSISRGQFLRVPRISAGALWGGFWWSNLQHTAPNHNETLWVLQ
jgi:hypothetical protein